MFCGRRALPQRWALPHFTETQMKGKELGWGRGAPPPPHWRGPRDKSHIPTWGREEGRVPGLVTPTDSSPEARGPEILESPPPLLCKFLYKELEGV